MDYKCKSVGEHPLPESEPAPAPSMLSYTQYQHPLTPPPMSYSQQQSLTYFTQQAIQAGYVAPQFEHKVVHNQHQPANLREAIWREIEKEKIREEIIAEDIARRSMLEIEVRRELMMERQLANQSGEGFSPFSSPLMSCSPMLPFLKQPSDVCSVEERIARSLEDRMGRGISVSRLGARNEIWRVAVPFEERSSEIPFQQWSVEPKISALKPVFHSTEPVISELQPSLEPSKGKDKVILLVKPNTSLSGAKRKADTPPPVEVSSQPPSFGVPKKNGKEDWSCALCQVSATCERGLNAHLQGKKHKSKEASLRAPRNGKNYSIGLFPKEPKTINLLEAHDNPDMEQMVKPKVELLPDNISGEGSYLVISEKDGAKDNITPSLHHHKDDLKKTANASPKKQKTNKKKKYKFWCAMCKIGALSEKSMEAHRVGKKHKARLQELNGSSVAISVAKVESIQTVNEALEDVEETTVAKVEIIQTVNEALEDVRETEVIDDVGAIVDRFNPKD